MQVLLISAALITISVSVAQSADVFCNDPPNIQFASISDVTDEDFGEGTIITYECQFGYSFNGEIRTLQCVQLDAEEDAEWTKPLFSCIPQSCGDPGDINNGRRIGSLFTFPNSVRYECDNGYKLVGLSARYCQTTGSWSGKLPRCEVVTCKQPSDPKNGYVIYSSLDYGSELRYKCDKGFRLNTVESVFCTSAGEWSKNDVECIESVCHIPSKPEHGSVQFSNTAGKPRTGSVAIFTCFGDRIAYGPTTSKCLEDGQWTFPPPKCLEPCNIPFVSRGEIGRYEKERYYSKNKVFKKIETGLKIEDNEELFLRCSNGYEVLGSNKNEENLFCRRGRWSREPQCEPAFCRSHPPAAENSEIVALNPEHGGHVEYRCFPDFRKVKNETIVCDFGNWKGGLPTCKTTSCSVNVLEFPGLLKGRKSSYRDGDMFDVECDSKYQVVNERQRQLKCEDGNWKGPLPPCIAASCTEPPPEVKFGRPTVASWVHSSMVKYNCEEPYFLTGNYIVQCLFGKWNGPLPKCEDSRCYLKDLSESWHVSEESSYVTNSGDQLNVVCKEGYSPKGEIPLCSNGKWTRNYESPCKEDGCSVPRVPYGRLVEQRLGDTYFNWLKLRYDREVYYEKVSPGKFVSPATSYILHCDTGYSFQGTVVGMRRITCSKGKWLPDPVCLPVGTKYVPTTSAPRTPLHSFRHRTQSQTSPVISSTTVKTTPTFQIATSTRETIAEEGTTTESATTVEECSCQYPVNDEYLIASVDGKQLKFRDQVKDGSVVVLRCEPVGVHTFIGPREIKCENCQSWHSSAFPSCVRPKRGDAVILYDNNINVSVEGILEVRRGQNVMLKCIAMESDVYPHWRVPTDEGIKVAHELNNRKTYGDVLYESLLLIESADFKNEGLYGCSVGNNTMNIVELAVIDPTVQCPEFQETEGISVDYKMGRYVKSETLFTCLKAGQELVGKAVLTCLRTGRWSDLPPFCEGIKCKELKQSDMLRISYVEDREVGSIASFHCFLPGIRSGVSFAKCLPNGSWSDPTPTCKSPPCSIDHLLSNLPHNVVPDMDDVTNSTMPYNSTIKLMCRGDLIIEGYPVAKCLKDGTWDIPNIQCASGCPPIEKSPESKLIVQPEKNIYKLGEKVTFSCPPGMDLNTKSELIMCLKNGWYGSETILPTCEEVEEEYQFEDTTQNIDHRFFS